MIGGIERVRMAGFGREHATVVDADERVSCTSAEVVGAGSGDADALELGGSEDDGVVAARCDARVRLARVKLPDGLVLRGAPVQKRRRGIDLDVLDAATAVASEPGGDGREERRRKGRRRRR